MTAAFEAYGEEPHFSYDLDQSQVHELTARLLQERPPQVEDTFVCYKVTGDDHFSDIGRTVEREVFEPTFGNDAEEMKGEYGEFEHDSTFFISVDTKRQVPTGALRVIQVTENGSKSLDDIEKHLHIHPQQVLDYYRVDDPKSVWDIGTVAVVPELQSAQGTISVQLYRAMYVAAMNEKIEHFVSIIDTGPLNKLVGYLGIPFEPLLGSEPFPYIGSESSQAVYGYVPDFYKKMNRKRWTLNGLMARKALKRLVSGSEDHTLQF